MFLMSLVSASFMPKKAPGHVELVDLSAENKHRRPLHRLESSSRKEDSVPRTRGFRSTTSNNNNNNVHGNNNGDVATTPITTSTGPSQTGAGRIAPYLPTNPINSTTLQKNEESPVVINSKPSKSQSFAHNDEEDIDVVWKEVVIDKLRGARQAARQRSHYANSSRKQKEASSVMHHPLASPEDEESEKNHEPAYLRLESLFAYIDEPGSPASSEDGDGGASVCVEDLRMHHMGSPTNSSMYALVHPSPPHPCEPKPSSSVLRICVPTLETLETVESAGSESKVDYHPLQRIVEESETDEGDQDLTKSDYSSKITIKKVHGDEDKLDDFKQSEVETTIMKRLVPCTSKRVLLQEFDIGIPEHAHEHPLQPTTTEDVEGEKKAQKKLEWPLKLDIYRNDLGASDVEKKLDLLEDQEIGNLSPKVADTQDQPSFRFWERNQPRKRKTHSVSKDFQELEDGEEEDDAQQQLGFGQQFQKGSFLEPHPSQKTLRAVATNKGNNLFHNKLSSPPNNNDDTECNTIMGEGEVPHEYPSPSSITCDLSPHSVYSDDQHCSVVEPFHHMENAGSLGLEMFSRFPAQNGMCCGSPTSVLSQEQGDEMPHLMSDSSEPVEPKEPKDRIRRRQSSASTFLQYRDESSDRESLCEGEDSQFKTLEQFVEASKMMKPRVQRLGFSKFTHSSKAMVETTSSEDEGEEEDEGPYQSRRREEEENHVNSNSDLRYFREAENWEPWLASSKDGDVLDPSDLDFLLPPDFQFKEQMVPDSQLEEICGKMEVLKISPGGSPTFGNKTSHHSQWVPYVTSTQGLQSPKGGSSRRQSLPQVFSQISKTIEKLAIGSNSKRTVNVAPDLVNVEPPQSPYPSPSASPIAMKDEDEDENISPSVSSWEVEGEVEDNGGPSNMTRRRRWRRSNAEEDSKLPSPTRTHRFSSRPRSTSFVPSKAKRRSTVPLVTMPCSGRLFSWPHRMMAFKVSKSRLLDSDDERESVDGEHSFGRSAHRNAQQVRRILRSSRKRFANLTVADILKEDFG